jgi:myosin heavy subunit
MYLRSLILMLLLACQWNVYAQEAAVPRKRWDSAVVSIDQLPQKYFSQIERKSRLLESRVNKRTGKALERLAREEQRMQAKLAKIDSLAAKNIFTKSIDSLGSLKSRLQEKAGKYTGLLRGGGYSGYLDTLQGSLKFLDQSKGLLDGAGGLKDKLNGSLQSVQQLQSKLQQAEQVKAFIRERRQQLKEQLSQYTGFTKELQNLSKEGYYYAQQLNEYKELFKDRKKAEAKAMELLKKMPVYNDFLKRNSQLASLFNLPAGGGADVAQSLEGLQTRSQVEQLIQERLGGGGPDARAAVSQQMSEARSRFEELKSKFPDSDNMADMPDFKPNEMKSKTFLQRLEFGGNLQFQRSNKYFPTTSDIAGQVAYKFHKNGSAGIGLAYKLGMGTGFNDIRFSHQGLGLRSFLDWKLKGTFYVNGGFEQNYQSGFSELSELRNWNGWKGSALIGVSKKYKISGKMKGNVMVLYDFLYNTRVPRTDPVKVRLGYSF